MYICKYQEIYTCPCAESSEFFEFLYPSITSFKVWLLNGLWHSGASWAHPASHHIFQSFDFDPPSARVSPFRGSAFWFFTLNDDGHFDGSSWHGGAAVAGDLGILGLTHPCGTGSRCFNWRDSKMHQQSVRPKTERTSLPKQIPDFRFQLQSHLYSQFWSMNTPVPRWPLASAESLMHQSKDPIYPYN